MQEFILLVVVGTSIWVLIDAKTIGVKKGQIEGMGNLGPWGWFFACLFLWIIGFPFYLAKRGEFKKANSSILSSPIMQQREKDLSPSAPDSISQLEKLGQLKEKGLITEEEFTMKKKEVLSQV